VALALKRLRNQAGLSIPAMAQMLGMRPSSYQHYEDRYKRSAFPSDFVAGVADVLRRHGLGEADLELIAAPSPQPVARQRDVLDELRALREELAELRREIARKPQ
jgi:transcriptional regulator with XRE-family HTH domain